MQTHELPPHETLTIEFKSDRKKLPDSDLLAAVICLANTEGGELWLGVEDDGTPTGLHPDHQMANALVGLIAARTSPSLAVMVEVVDVQGIRVARISVPQAHSATATTAGVYLRRRLKFDGSPECVPLLPHDFISRSTTLGQLDLSAQPVQGAQLSDFDPLERERLRQNIQHYGGDRILLELDDEALDGALGLTRRTPDGSRIPTLLGLLLLGREAALRQFVPTHELAFQVLEREAVRFNEFRRFPLLKLLDWLETSFRPFNPERELQVGLFRVPVPQVDRAAFREAIANAIIHRDYTRLGAVHVRLDDEGLTISNPGGLVEGVTLHNLLTTEPRPRNPALADAMKRIGLVERSGRGVDLIYRGLLRFGRPQPDYRRTDAVNVVLKLSTAEADLNFLKMVVDEESQRGSQLPIDSLITLAVLREYRRITSEELAQHLQKDLDQAKRVLETLHEAGLVQAHGVTKGRSYTLSAGLYQALGDKAAYTRQVGFSSLQNEQLILNYVAQHGQISRSEAMELCRLSEGQAKALLRKLTQSKQLQMKGASIATFYTKPDECG
ncbi:ATPase [Thiothrix subterranea]|uniref:ATP-binding protein n=1 Tax=Thiothrix subterranea TaxID=2735563 RepID=UPI00192B6D9D|nr:ATP-binding protein [Thiothrix subterranea]QQZ28782.1 ATPase [Thiothrix subterranea]